VGSAACKTTQEDFALKKNNTRRWRHNNNNAGNEQYYFSLTPNQHQPSATNQSAVIFFHIKLASATILSPRPAEQSE